MGPGPARVGEVPGRSHSTSGDSPDRLVEATSRSRPHISAVEVSTNPAHAARIYAGLGWPLLPCHAIAEGRCACGDVECGSPGKHPLLRHGLHDASSITSDVDAWWRRWPAANVGVRTGRRPDGSGLVVIDIDPAHGGDESFEELGRTLGSLPETLSVATGGGGRHLYFRHPEPRIGNSAGRLGPGIDVRSDGGYVIAPPSLHRSGRSYRWRPAPIVPLPDSLVRLLRQDNPQPASAPPVAPTRPCTAWAKTALEQETRRVIDAAEGGRNHALNRAAFALGQLVAGGHLEENVVRSHLAAAAATAGLAERETVATISSGLRAGARSPRHPATR
jgi:hypothetical protein